MNNPAGFRVKAHLFATSTRAELLNEFTTQDTSMVYEFAFSRARAPIGPDTGEVIFEIDLGGWTIQSKFNTKDMVYRGQLAL